MTHAGPRARHRAARGAGSPALALAPAAHGARALALLASATLASAVLGCSPPRGGAGQAPPPPASGAGPHEAPSAAAAGRAVVYASEGEQLHTLALDARSGELAVIASVSLPEPVHYAAADPAARALYVSTSDGANRHGLHAFAIDRHTGALAEHGAPLVPPLGRIIHLSIDLSGRHLVLAHNRAGQLSSVRLDADGRLASFVEQAAPAQMGFFPHQALLDPAGSWLVACGLGRDASPGAAEEPGSLAVFRHDAGQLTLRQTVRPGPGLGPRHLDYAGDHVFVVMERSNRLATYRFEAGALGQRPEFESSTLQHPERARPGQRAGAIHRHPNGKFLYVSNRSSRTTRVALGGEAVEVFAGGDNDIALFALEPGSAEPRPVAHHPTRGFEPRTFTIVPDGQFLIVANQSERQVIEGGGADGGIIPGDAIAGEDGVGNGVGPERGALRTVPRSLVVFAVAADGRLHYRHAYPFTRGDLFWIGSLALPG